MKKKKTSAAARRGSGDAPQVETAFPATAKYEGMPKSALNTGFADFVLPVDEMPRQLIAYTQRIIKKQPAPASLSEKAPSAIQKVLLILRSQTGHDFSFYTKSTIHRRVEKRMDLHNIGDPGDHALYLQENPDEAQALFKELLIGVTSYFRDPEAFEALKERFLPQILDDKAEGYFVRVWVPGCASDEEAIELRSTNEEFQSTNEELEASKGCRPGLGRT